MQKKHDDQSPSRVLSSTQGGCGLRGVSCDGTLGDLTCLQMSNYYQQPPVIGNLLFARRCAGHNERNIVV